ncbi:Sarcoplasmic calcium-binding protein 1 [Eumeta japonica]|uniref:Sarcoplasmic calcium-binding protein 1 n=1 Tax=Eumeta variegata TaxID=151549 RepID=A0A4C1YVE3_EUMVA|nr:Sarcoplasmic calcium-binding protein 1 [Eumeta japonica]
MLSRFQIPDIDNNGYLDAHDFHCLAVRSCVLEGKGDCSAARLQKYQHVMLSLWEEIAQLADFDKVPDYVGYQITLAAALSSSWRH